MNEIKPLAADASPLELDRRHFLRTSAAVAAGTFAAGLPLAGANWLQAAEIDKKASPESLVKQLYGTFSDAQKKEICFDWDHTEPGRGLLRTRISNNWHIL